MSGFFKLSSLFVWGGVAICPIIIHAETKLIDMGYWLDQAAMACANKDRDQLKRIESKINSLLKITPELQNRRQYLLGILGAFEGGQCYIPIRSKHKKITKAVSKSKKRIKVQQKNNTLFRVATGFANNINNGVKHDNISVNSLFGSEKVNLTIGEGSRPISDVFYSLKLSHSHEISDKYTTYLDIRSQFYQKNHDYNFSVAKAGLSSGIASTESTYDVSAEAVWLERKIWEKNVKVKVRTPLYEDKKNKLTLEGALKNSWHLSHNQYSAMKFEVSGSYQRHLSDQLKVGAFIAGAKDDVYSASRLGGDKRSYEFSASTRYQFTPKITANAQVSYESLQDELPYSPALFGAARRHQKKEAMALYVKANLKKNSWVDFSYVRDKSEDNYIALFDTPWSDYVSVGFGYRW